MTHHSITVTRDEDGDIDSIAFSCSAEPGTDCKRYPACDCEYWSEDHDLDEDTGEPRPGHEIVAHDNCWMLSWFEAMDTMDHLEYVVVIGAGENGEDLEGHSNQDLIQDGPVELIWRGEDEYYFTTAPREAKS